MRNVLAALALFAAVFATAITGAPAAGLKAAEGNVILTIGGNIANANRGPFDPGRDGFLKHHERKFDKAAEFDLSMLESLGMHTAKVSHKNLPGEIAFSGPRLADVLKAAGWNGTEITTLALDGYGTKIDKTTLGKFDWILATRANGKPLGIGAKGPLWLVFDPPGNAPATDAEEGMWPWALFYIQAN